MTKKMMVEIFHVEYNSVIISTVIGKVSTAKDSLIYATGKWNMPLKVELWFISKQSARIQMVHLNNIHLRSEEDV